MPTYSTAVHLERRNPNPDFKMAHYLRLPWRTKFLFLRFLVFEL